MQTFEEIAHDLVARWEHGDDEHRKWLRDIAVPDIVAALEAVAVKDAPHLPRCPADHVRHDDVLYPHWLKVREVLLRPNDGGATTGDYASAVIDALRRQLLNETAALTRMLHDGAAAAGWTITLRAFARLALDKGYRCSLVRIPTVTTDGWALTHALIIELPTGQVSWRGTEEDAAALCAVGVPLSAVPYDQVWDGHGRDTKYRRLETFARGLR